MFVLQEVKSSFVHLELSKLKSKKATGLDGLSAKLLKDAAPVIDKPIAYLLNLCFLTNIIRSLQIGKKRKLPQYLNQERRVTKIITDLSLFFR